MEQQGRSHGFHAAINGDSWDQRRYVESLNYRIGYALGYSEGKELRHKLGAL